MKLAHFKRGCKRGNFHSPVKSAAEFWAMQSDYQARQICMRPDSHYHLRSAVDSGESQVIVSGPISQFVDSDVCQILRDNNSVGPGCNVEFLRSIVFHGVQLSRGEHAIVDSKLYSIERVLRLSDTHCLYLRLQNEHLHVDELGMLLIRKEEMVLQESFRLLALHNASDVTGVYTVSDVEHCMLVVKP